MYAIRPAVATVGVGSVKACPAVVWLTLNVVAPSTVAAAEPIAPVVRLPSAIAMFKVAPALVNVVAFATVRPPLAETKPLNVGLLTIANVVVVKPEPAVPLSEPVRLPLGVNVKAVLPWAAVLAAEP